MSSIVRRVPSPFTSGEARLIVTNDHWQDRCPLCSGVAAIVGRASTPWKTPFSTHQIELTQPPLLARCGSCGTGFIQNAIPPAVALRLYTEGHGESWSGVFDETKTAADVAAIRDLVREGDRCVDIGCNGGELLDFLKKLQARTFGVEPSIHGRRVAAGKGHAVAAALAELPGQFDLISAFDVVEHLYDLPAVMAEWRSRLSAKGRIVLVTGNIDSATARADGPRWWYLRWPEHVLFPSLKALSSFPGLRLARVQPTYPNRNHEPGFLLRLRNRLRGRGFANDPDHFLVVLENDSARGGDGGRDAA